MDNIKPIACLEFNINLKKKVNIYSASAYVDPLKNLIFEKFYAKNSLACKYLAQIIYKKTVIKDLKIDYLIPVPLHWTRFAKRGYNQSKEISIELSKLLNVPILDILKREKKTAYQSTLTYDDKQINLKNAFSLKDKYINKNLLKNKKIFIVDDLFTSGATISNVANVLFKEEAESINVIVVCRVV
jgi:ComF family protein